MSNVLIKFVSNKLTFLLPQFPILNLLQQSTMFGKINIPQKNSFNSHPTSKLENIPKTKPIEKFPKPKNKKNKGRVDNHQKLASLKGSKFRILNQLLYTRPSQDSLEYFKEHKQDFEIYHEGFREQAAKWSQNPLHSIINYLKKHHADKNKLILDLGCGQAELQQKMSSFTKVRSFDLVAKKEFVEIADISNLPVKDKQADACVFCLSLMGTNYIEFLKQAKRVLKQNGQLLIAEVQSRCKQWNNFIKMIESLGFECKTNKSNNYFRLLYFILNQNNQKKLKIDGEFKDLKEYSKQILGSCLYKKR